MDVMDAGRRVAMVAWLVPLGLGAQDRPPRLAVELEAGAVFQSSNDVEIPNDGSATRFSLRRLAGKGPWSAGRVYVTWQPAERHALRLLDAPLSISSTGTSATPIRFAGATFSNGAPVQATYTFNSYRLTYRYHLRRDAQTSVWVGGTGKVRDATIALQQGTTSRRKDDLGFVPLLHVSAAWRPARSWQLTLDADAIAGGPGRAEDVAVGLGRELGDQWTLRAGYRLVEGGADVPDVYTFAFLHYAVIGLKRQW